jgi:outer membrane protein
MKLLLKISFIFFLFSSFNQAFSDVPYYIDFKYILNSSVAGKKAQDELKKRLEQGVASLEKKEKTIQEEEKKLIQQKKVISPEEYKKKISELRKNVSNLQKERNKIIGDVSKQRAKAKSELLKNLNPIIHDYMKEKKIRMVINKKDLISADENLDITKDIMQILNKKLKSIKLN